MGDKYSIFKFNRSDSVFVINNFDSKVFVPEIICEQTREIISKWKDNVNLLASNCSANYNVLMSYDTNSLIVINNKNGSPIQNSNVLITSDTVKKWMFRTHESLAETIAIYAENNFEF